MTRYVSPPQYKTEPATPFAEHAAKFSLYVPAAVLLITLLHRASTRRQPEVDRVILLLNITLIAAGFILGVIALFFVKRLGPERILGRAILGIILNGVVLVPILYVATAAIASAGAVKEVKEKVIGQWRMTSGGADANIKQLDIAFNKDDTFKLATTRNDGVAVVVTGTWTFSPVKLITVTVQNVAGSDGSMDGKKMALGVVKTADDQQLILATDKGQETYKRLH